MKKLFAISCFIACSFNQSIAQVSFGVKAGLNLSNVQFPEPSGTRTNIAFYGGLLSEITLGKKCFVQPELLYSIKGFKFDATQFISGGHVNINYISIPLLVGFRPIEKLKILAGPEFNFLASAKSKIDNTSNSLSDSYKKIDVGIDLSTAYQLQKNVAIEVRYNYGISYLAESTIIDGTGNEPVKVKVGKIDYSRSD